MSRSINRWTFSLAMVVSIAGVASVAAPAMGQGVALRAVSPISESMAGVGTACPIDSAGAMHCNPASITGLPSSDISFGMTLVLPTTNLSSTFMGASGSDSGEAGAIPAPSMAFVHKSPDSQWSYGVGVFAVGGSAVNFPASTTNPILRSQAHHGLGQLSANVEVFQIVPTLAYQLNEHWSVGVSPIITMGKLYADPLFLGPQDNGVWSSGVGTRYAWGGGAQAGVYCTTDSNWNFGASLASPQWCEPFRYKSINASGEPINVSYDLDYPLIASFGTSYTGYENWIIACDLRYYDYANTEGFRDSGFNADNSVKGLGWKSIMAVAIGVQRQFSERLAVRCGYCYNENPITSDAAFYNVASPLITQHTVHIGGSCVLPGEWIASLAYCHAFENSVSGPWHSPPSGVAIPGSSVTSTISADVLSMGISKRF